MVRKLRGTSVRVYGKKKPEGPAPLGLPIHTREEGVKNVGS
jgi:hypothetical protein